MTNGFGRWLRDNVMIAVSIALPLLIVALFAVASLVPNLLADPPAYDLVLVMDAPYAESTPSPVRVELTVSDERLRARVYAPGDNERPFLPRIFEYVAATGSVREIAVVLPDGVEQLPDGAEIPIPELARRRLVTTVQAPDGYTFEQYRRGGGGLFVELFGAGSRGYEVRLTKGSAVTRVRIPSLEPYAYYNIRFAGWAVE